MKYNYSNLSEKDFKNVTIEKNVCGYYLVINLQNEFFSEELFLDNTIAEFLGLTVSKYFDILKKFNIIPNISGIFFENLKDAENAKNWLNENAISLLTVKKMVK